MYFSVIIPTYNRADILRRTLNLLAVQTYPKNDFEVLVINDGSTDRTARLLAEFAAKKIFTLKFLEQKNAGASSARNLGLAKAQGKIIVFLDDDVFPQPNFLAAHATFHALFPGSNLAALGLTHLHPELPKTRLQKFLERSGLQFKFQDLRAKQQVDFRRFYTANLSLKREFLGSQNFDLDFQGWGFEDLEFGYRLQKAGLKLLFWPTALGLHFHAIEVPQVLNQQFSAGRNAILFQRKHPECRILPTGLKLGLQKLVAGILPFSFYARTKKAFWAGVTSGSATQR